MLCDRHWKHAPCDWNQLFFLGDGWVHLPSTSVHFYARNYLLTLVQFWIRRRHFGWWSRYNYILSAALDSGVAVATILIFFCKSTLPPPFTVSHVLSGLQFPRRGALELHWWGNDVSTRTADGRGVGHIQLTKGSAFGAPTWS
jgi:hypothetical protein